MQTISSWAACLAAFALALTACGDHAGPRERGEPDEAPDRRTREDRPDWTLAPPAQEPAISDLVGRPALPEPGTVGVLELDVPEPEVLTPPIEARPASRAPTAVARVRLAEDSAGEWDSELEVAPLVRVQLDGRASDGYADIAAWDWWVMEAPPGGLRDFEPNARVAAPIYFIPTAGTYQLALQVRDAEGRDSENVAVLKITAVYGDGGIVVELSWETPNDPNPLDFGGANGSDVDLHFMHPNGHWNQAPWDCYWSNKNPNWGVSSSADDPALDIDDTDGWGPETIRLEHPEGDASEPFVYKVGVFYFSDHAFGPSHARIRIYTDGALRLETTLENLENRQFWDVARITWPSREIELVDRLYPSGFP